MVGGISQISKTKGWLHVFGFLRDSGAQHDGQADACTCCLQTGLKREDVVEILGLGAMANPMFALKGPLMNAGKYSPAFPLKHQQKDMRLALALG